MSSIGRSAALVANNQSGGLRFGSQGSAPQLVRKCTMETPSTFVAVETIGKWDYLRAANGDLYRARAQHRIESRTVELVAPWRQASFALRLARMDAVSSENEH
jgi:hypothetical protein